VFVLVLCACVTGAGEPQLDRNINTPISAIDSQEARTRIVLPGSLCQVIRCKLIKSSLADHPASTHPTSNRQNEPHLHSLAVLHVSHSYCSINV